MDIKEIREKIGPKSEVILVTFNLTPEAHDAITKLSRFLGIKNPRLFEFIDAFIPAAIEAIKEDPSIIKATRIRKTYRIKTDTLTLLEDAAMKNQIARDFIVEWCVNRYGSMLLPFRTSNLMYLLEGEREAGGVIQIGIKYILDDMAELKEEAEDLLDSGDPFIVRYNKIHSELKRLVNDIEKEVGQKQ